IGTNAGGGADSATRNIISGNTQAGIELGGIGTQQNVVADNFLGTDSSGVAALPNLRGIRIAAGASNNTIGGTLSAARNVISGNRLSGVLITDPGTSQNLIEGNYLGLDMTGMTPLGNNY